MAAKDLNLDVTFVTKNITVSKDFISIGKDDSVTVDLVLKRDQRQYAH